MKISRKTNFPVFAGLFILSASGIALEVSLTRLFSFLFTHSYVYIIISISMAGLGLGAVIMSVLSAGLREKTLRWIIILPPSLLAVMLLSNIFQTGIFPSLLTTLLIFFCIGMFQILVFQQFKIAPGKLYAADLGGAAAGSVAAFLILNGVGALAACIILTAAISSACIMIYYVKFLNKPAVLLSAALTLVSIAALIFITSGYSLFPQKSLMKEMTIMLEDETSPAKIAETRWSAFGRVDLIETDNPLFKTMFIDGAAGTKMINMESGTVSRDTAQTLLYQYMGGVPLLGVNDAEKDKALVIGSGGGIDVVTALLAGYNQIDAVEINPDFIDIVKDYSSYTGGIYTENPQVNLIEGEGRSFIRASKERYNLILMSLPIIKSARNYGNQALTENYLFTVEAFKEYLARLGDDGIIVIVAHYPNELMKLAVNAAAALESSGLTLQQAMKQIITIGADNSPAIIIKNRPFTTKEAQTYYTILEGLSLRGTTNFIPGFSQRSKTAETTGGEARTVYEFNPGLYNLSAGTWTLSELTAANSENISRVTDDSPFFYQMDKKIPREIALVSLIASVMMAGILVIFVIKKYSPELQPELKPSLMHILSFGSIGVGFMFIEISYLQKFIFYWQHQTLALAIVLSIILISSGIGSFISGKFAAGRRFAMVIVILLLLLISGMVIANPLLNATSTQPAAIKFLVTILLTGPVFLLMGMPFPVLLEMNFVHNNSRKDFPWMIGFNSLASLTGGVFSMVIAFNSGYTLVMTAGIIAYTILLMITVFGIKAELRLK